VVNGEQDTKLLGLKIDLLQAQSVRMGGLVLEVSTQSVDSTPMALYVEGSQTKCETPTVRGPRETPFESGLKFQLAQFNTSQPIPTVTPYFSVEFGYVSVLLQKADRKPLLDGFFLLNSVRLTTVLDLVRR
jgi:hypothetical protein